MSTENYPSDDRTFPRNWTNFKKTLTWPKRMYLGWLGDGTKYDDVQSFLMLNYQMSKGGGLNIKCIEVK